MGIDTGMGCGTTTGPVTTPTCVKLPRRLIPQGKKLGMPGLTMSGWLTTGKLATID
jgi:hypothetical protein